MNGLSHALARLNAMPAQAEQAAARSARAAAQQALQSARSLVPVRTGALKSSLRVTALPRGGALTTACPYALHVERGSRRTPAQPFLTPAFHAARDPAFFAQALKEAIL